MKNLSQALAQAEALSFDCYGTIIDWVTGLNAALARVFGNAANYRRQELFDAYLAAEMEVEQQRYRPYREVLAEAAFRAGRSLGISVDRAECDLVPASLPDWPAFDDSVAALKRLHRRFRLGVLSNVDRDLFLQTQERLGVAFDFLVTAEDVRAYKPAHAHFERMFREHVSAERVIHVAQSLYHDGVATRALSIPFVWINRQGERNETSATVVAGFPDLAGLADAVDEILG